MKIITILLAITFSIGAIAQPSEQTTLRKFTNMITPDGLSTSLHFIASDYFKGRGSGTEDEKAVASYLANCYMLMGISPLNRSKNKSLSDVSYFQKFDYQYGGKTKKSQNVISILEGSDPVLKNEAIIIVAHYDHLGKDSTLTGDQIFNGAADDGSGTAALLHMAKSFAAARDSGKRPKRSIIFFHAGAEENGVRGSTYYVNNDPIWPLEKTVAVINMDGIGGSDTAVTSDKQNYVYVLYEDSTSGHLYQKTKELNSLMGSDLKLLYPKDPNVFNSDHRPFAYELVPYVYFSTGLIEHFHKVSDGAETINFAHMTKIARLVFAVSWEAAMNKSFRSKFDRSLYTKNNDRFVCPPCGCGKDNTFFNKPGVCDACTMPLQATWEKKRSK